VSVGAVLSLGVELVTGAVVGDVTGANVGATVGGSVGVAVGDELQPTAIPAADNASRQAMTVRFMRFLQGWDRQLPWGPVGDSTADHVVVEASSARGTGGRVAERPATVRARYKGAVWARPSRGAP
jgi:hypothetical protein